MQWGCSGAAPFDVINLDVLPRVDILYAHANMSPDLIDAAIKKCLAMLLIFSDHCNENDYIRREPTVAGNCRKLVLPVRIEDAQPKRGLRVRLSDLHWIDGFVAREQALDAVAQALSLGPATARQRAMRRLGATMPWPCKFPVKLMPI